MTEQELIASAIGLCIGCAPIIAFFYAKLAWQELKWFMFLYLGVIFIKIDKFARAQGLEEWIIDDYSGIKLSKIKVFKAGLWHLLCLMFYLYFTVWFAILPYECAKWIFNFIFGG